MNELKKYLGVLWILTGICVMAGLLYAAMHFISQGGTRDIHNPVIWVIIIGIFTPISIGLAIFGWYVLKDEYQRLPADSSEI